MTRPSGNTARLWLKLLRVSNYPTVVSNALTGCALGIASGAAFPWRVFAMTAPALTLIYAMGMIANDVLDVKVDRVERPDRPIASGAISRTSAVWAAVVAGVVAVGLLVMCGPWAGVMGAVVVVCALVYDAVHEASVFTVALMAGCRALTYVTAAAAVAWPVDCARVGPFAVGLGVYVCLISLVARAEAGKPRRVKVVVSMVCAISLVDAGILVWLGRPVEAGIAVVCFVMAAWMQRRVIGS